MIELLVGETIAFVDNFMTHLTNCVVVQMFIKQWPLVKNFVVKMWKALNEADLIAFLKNLHVGKYYTVTERFSHILCFDL